MDPTQCRMARGALDWSMDDLAEAASLSRRTIGRFEGGGPVGPNPLQSIERAFSQRGIRFIAPGTVSVDSELAAGIDQSGSAEPFSASGGRFDLHVVKVIRSGEKESGDYKFAAIPRVGETVELSKGGKSKRWRVLDVRHVARAAKAPQTRPVVTIEVSGIDE